MAFLHRAATTFSRSVSVLTRTGTVARHAPKLGAALCCKQQVRHLNLHEYQSKELMSKYKVRVQKGKPANTPDEAEQIAEELKAQNAKDLIVKAQILAGGRGKGTFNTGFKGGVKIAQTPKEVREYAEKMLGNVLITHQTGPSGQKCDKVLIHEGVDFNREFYLAILMDRDTAGPVVVASPMGGMDIEEVAKKHPDQIHMQKVDMMKGLQPAEAGRIASLLHFKEGEPSFKDAQQQMLNLYKLFVGCDATQVEVNPFVVTTDGKVYCVDAKIGFDDNAQFRQKQLFAQRDTSMEDPREVAASKVGLNYIGLDGNIGCMVNGAGLAMATMDVIKLHGGEPANFLDVGGGASENQVAEAFRILTADPKVKAILVNIFGGIMKCDVLASGIVKAAKKIGLKLPLVVRLEGTNVEKGKAILRDSGLTLIAADDLDDAAKKAVSTLTPIVNHSEGLGQIYC